uniref:Nucleotide-diphospho-sugar transferase domain-containing protein n=1 Tax=viral metagenome TaxID=1070528 RepID=A0A6C0D6W4_9ZZZZ
MKLLTLAIGEDFRKSLSKALESKKDYCEVHDYEFVLGDEKFWDRERPIPWSKIPFLLHVLNNSSDGEFIFMSDADVYITNLEFDIEESIVSLLLEEKDLFMTIDSCGHINDGNILIRNSEWSRDFWKRVYEQTDLLYHPWWENAAVIKLIETNKSDLDKVQITSNCRLFNAYIQGLEGMPLWQPGDFLVHFAGIYDVKRMNYYIDQIEEGKIPRKNIWE